MEKQSAKFPLSRKIIILGSVAILCMAVSAVGLVLAFSNRPVQAAVAGSEHLTFIDNADQTGYEVWGFNAAGLALTNVELTIPRTYSGKPVTGIRSGSLQSLGAFFLTNLVSVSFEIPSNVTSIGANAFNSCSALTSFTIPASVTSIGKEAFTGCRRLTSITIPPSVMNIDGNIFKHCYDLISIIVDEGNTAYSSGPEGSNCIIRMSDNTLISGCSKTVIPASVTGIGNGAYSGCDNLRSITIPASVASIGDSAFSSCYRLTAVTILAGVASIGGGAFFGTGLTSITIPASVTSIGRNPFDSCRSLTSITVDPGNIAYRSETNNCIIRESDNVLISGCINTNIPDSVTSIGDSAFRYCAGLTSITIPSSVESIGEQAFLECAGLTAITIPSSVANIGNSAFGGCAMTTIKIPSSVANIGMGAFAGCTNLKTVKLERFSVPNTITTLGANAFNNSTGLVSIIVPYADGAAKEAYGAAANWSVHASIIYEDLPEYDGIVRLRSASGTQELSGDIKKVWRYGAEVLSTLQLPSADTMNGAQFTGMGKQFYGYRFEGWYDNKECSGVAVDEIPVGASGTLYYYAKWVRSA